MNVISHSVDVKTTLEIPAKTIKLEGTKGEEVELIPPSGTLGYKPIPLLLLSHKWREGQQTVSVCVYCVSGPLKQTRSSVEGRTTNCECVYVL